MKTIINTIDINRQYQKLKKKIKSAINKVLEKQSFILGPETSELEKKFAEYCGVKYGVGCSSGTSALFLALEALNFKESDEVITTPLTFIATASAIVSARLKPVFVDVDEITYNLQHMRFGNLKTDHILESSHPSKIHYHLSKLYECLMRTRSVKPIFMCNFLGNIFVSLRSRLNISVYAAKAGLIGERAAW